MLMARTPVRITLGGGGTDLASYYCKFGGSLVTAAIDKYIFLTLIPRFEGDTLLKYSKSELVQDIGQIEHPLIRETFRLLGFREPVEIVSMANIPPNSGLGTSGAFTVGMLHLLHTFRRDPFTPEQLAEWACHIEIDVLGRPVGKQDQYITAFGGLQHMEIDTEGRVTMTPIRLSMDTLDGLERNALMFYTGLRRDASRILADQQRGAERDEHQVVEALHQIKEIGDEIRHALETGNLRRFGELWDVHWQTKKRLSDHISNDWIDECYDAARSLGVIGGKITGAGGGGFFVFYCEDNRDALRAEMQHRGLKEMPFRFDFDGSRIILNV